MDHCNHCVGTAIIGSSNALKNMAIAMQSMLMADHSIQIIQAIVQIDHGGVEKCLERFDL